MRRRATSGSISSRARCAPRPPWPRRDGQPDGHFRRLLHILPDSESRILLSDVVFAMWARRREVCRHLDRALFTCNICVYG
jgi:hypothetical protein